MKKNKCKMKVDAVIFDLDGTLLDSMQIYYKIVELTLEKLGFPMVSRKEMREAAKDGDFEWDRMIPPDVKHRKKDIMLRIREIIDEVYPGMFRNEVKPISGAETIIKWLAVRGLKLGIVTSTPKANVDIKLQQLQKLDINRLFEVIITSDDVKRKKPAPDPMLECCRQLNVKPEKSVYLGDARTDIRSAKAANMKAIGVLTGFDDYQALEVENPDYIINSVSDLKNIIRV